jgi:predicted methyltransferase
MKRNLMLAAATAVLIVSASAPAFAKPSAVIEAAVADKARPEADTKRDAARKPADMLDFAGIKPGQTVADFLPGGGYFTRVFAKAVGPKGTVYALVPEQQLANKDKPPAIIGVAADPAYSNIKIVPMTFATLTLPTPADVIWTAENYHDLHLTRLSLDVPAVNKAVFNALKPGGYYIVLDHVAADGAPVDVANTLHRIDPAIVKKELEAAGFKFVGESKILRRATDDHTQKVFDLHDATDQFIYKFQRPK